MGTSLTLEAFRITDYLVAINLVSECWDEISEDGVDSYTPDIVNEYWVGLRSGTDIVGCYRFHQRTSIWWEGHVFMSPKFRKKYSDEGMRKIMLWILEYPKFPKITCSVPSKFENVIRFLERSGLTNEGVNKQAFTKDGKVWDIVNYGITIEDIYNGFSSI